MKDLHDDILLAVGINPTQVNSNATTVGNIIDRNTFEEVEFCLYSGAYTSGSFQVLIEEGNDPALADAATVADVWLLPAVVYTNGTAQVNASRIAAQLTGANQVKRIGYNGAKRYVRASFVSTTVVTTGALVGALVILGAPDMSPTANN